MDDLTGIPPLDTSLLPIFKSYKQQTESWLTDFDEWSYLSLRADFDLAAAFTKLFWPDLILVDGCVMLRRNYSPEGFMQWMKQHNRNRRAVERVLNHVHIKDLFPNSPNDVHYPEGLYDYLADALAFGWKQALRSAYPSKHFIFTLTHGHDPQITFCQGGHKPRTTEVR